MNGYYQTRILREKLTTIHHRFFTAVHLSLFLILQHFYGRDVKLGGREFISVFPRLTLLLLFIHYVFVSPAMHAQTQTFERLLTTTNNDLILVYNITRSVEITNVSGIPMSYDVRQEYMIRIRALNTTHISVQGFRFPESAIHLTLSSSDWLGIGGLTYWVLSNYTDFLAKNVLPEYNVTVDRNVAVDFINSVLVLPILREETSGTCMDIPVANAYVRGFTVVVSTNLGSGNAYYDCKYGIFFKAYITKTTRQSLGTTTYLVKDSISIELYRANTEILNEIVIRERAWNLYEALIYVVPTTSIAVATVAVLTYVFRIRKRSIVSSQSPSG
ncbi:MAG: hypothetical protein ACP5KB_05760 [Thermoprotei archaeon]